MKWLYDDFKSLKEIEELKRFYYFFNTLSLIGVAIIVGSCFLNFSNLIKIVIDFLIVFAILGHLSVVFDYYLPKMRKLNEKISEDEVMQFLNEQENTNQFDRIIKLKQFNHGLVSPFKKNESEMLIADNFSKLKEIVIKLYQENQLTRLNIIKELDKVLKQIKEDEIISAKNELKKAKVELKNDFLKMIKEQ